MQKIIQVTPAHVMVLNEFTFQSFKTYNKTYFVDPVFVGLLLDNNGPKEIIDKVLEQNWIYYPGASFSHEDPLHIGDACIHFKLRQDHHDSLQMIVLQGGNRLAIYIRTNPDNDEVGVYLGYDGDDAVYDALVERGIFTNEVTKTP